MAHFAHMTVLTGDIVGSQDLQSAALDQAFAALQDAAAFLAQPQDHAVFFTRFRGDGWQLALEHPGDTATALALIWTALHGQSVATRVAVAKGDGTVDNADLSSASGPAFLASGRGLDAMPRGQTLWMDSHVPTAWRAALPLLAEIAEGWTARQAQVCHAALRFEKPLNVSALAASLGMAKQTVHTHLDRSGFEALQAAIEALQ